MLLYYKQVRYSIIIRIDYHNNNDNEQGGSWRVHACKLTSAGAPPLVTAGRSLVKLLECRVGGMDADKGRSSSGVIVTGESRCCLHTCVVEYTDNQYNFC